ncbi:hypothetical protein SULPSESMR1_04939 (plasmid) [Pseudosulfitobacter pseudonitzschiae]|uniref:Uncharacterized protein n=1 Tax=Pseudosulfitobacter pseudonitzschiae TaxID=1402135 RepID=A0A221K6J6_9RHOB|nr:hypothetical protein SULPSESMR1_04939 [Pseudosulfitobacter pseudonitzschiae]
MYFSDAIQPPLHGAWSDDLTLSFQKGTDCFDCSGKRYKCLLMAPGFEGLDIRIVTSHGRRGVGTFEAVKLDTPIVGKMMIIERPHVAYIMPL